MAHQRAFTHRVTRAVGGVVAVCAPTCSVAPSSRSLFFSRNTADIKPGDTIVVPLDAERMKPLAKLGLKISVLSPAQMKKLGMNALLGVAQASPKAWQGL